MSQLQTERKTPGDWLKFEEEGRYCRETVTILAGSGSDRELVSGTVLGKITSGGKYVALNPDASDGSQNAAGILFESITAIDGTDNPGGVAIVRGPAVVSLAGLTWTSDTDLDQDVAVAQLEVLGIQVREGV